MSQKRRATSGSDKRCLFLLLLSLCLTAVIAAGLPHLVFQPGMPLPSFENGQIFAPARDEAPVGMGMGSFGAILGLIVLGVCLLAFLIRAMRGVPWKKLLADSWSLLWKIGLVACVVLVVASLLPRSGGSAREGPLPQPRPLATAPLGPVPAFLFWVAGIVLGALLVALSLRVLLARRRPETRPWVQEVARARQALLNGGDLRDVIIRCYTFMSAALQEERGIERETFMTAGEFESLLTDKGIPRDPVHQLTRLFEAARYSLQEPVSGDERTAIACLDAILEHSRRAAPAGETA